MAALPFHRESLHQPNILKLFSATYTLDPYADRLLSSGYEVVEATDFDKALKIARQDRPSLILVYDNPENGMDARKWLETQHYAREGWLATTPLLILADSLRAADLRSEELPDRVVVLQRRADTLNQLTRVVKRLLKVTGAEQNA